MPPCRETADDQAGIRRRREPDRQIKTFVDHVDLSFSHGQVDHDIGVGREKFGSRRRNERDHMGSGVDAQRAARRRLQGAGDVVGLFEISKYLCAAIVELQRTTRRSFLSRRLSLCEAHRCLRRHDVVAGVERTRQRLPQSLVDRSYHWSALPVLRI